MHLRKSGSNPLTAPRFLLLLLLLTAAALALRLPVLDNRPLHGDEGVHAFKFRELWETGAYRYDPNEFHGPLLYYATLPVVQLSGVHSFGDITETHYRLVPVLFGAAMVLLLVLLADGLGEGAILWAALLLALSPACVFYSRYYIQETLLACFSLGLLGAGWRYARSGRPGWLLLAGLCAGLMVASKETAFLSFGALAIALAAQHRSLGLRQRWNPRHATLALSVGVLTAALFLSGFFSNPSGPFDYFRSFSPWLQRAGATDLHRHPWHYYLSMLLWTHRLRGPVWSEALILGLALVGLRSGGKKAKGLPLACPAGLPRKENGRQRMGHWPFRSFTTPHPSFSVACGSEVPAPRLVRLLGVYTLLLTSAYSAIPYKTPWCLLQFLLGLIMLAGVGAAALVRWTPRRWLQAVVSLLLLAGAVQLGQQAYRTSFLFMTDGRNPYAYAQTAPDTVELGKRVEALARVAPEGEAMVVKVFAQDEYYWPLPWYLRRLPNVGYWIGLPRQVEAAVVIASPEFSEELARRLGTTHQSTGYYGLRPTVVFEVWVRASLWAAYLKERSKDMPP